MRGNHIVESKNWTDFLIATPKGPRGTDLTHHQSRVKKLTARQARSAATMGTLGEIQIKRAQQSHHLRDNGPNETNNKYRTETRLNGNFPLGIILPRLSDQSPTSPQKRSPPRTHPFEHAHAPFPRSELYTHSRPCHR